MSDFSVMVTSEVTSCRKCPRSIDAMERGIRCLELNDYIKHTHRSGIDERCPFRVTALAEKPVNPVINVNWGWEGAVDRQGGSFTQDEINDSEGWR